MPVPLFLSSRTSSSRPPVAPASRFDVSLHPLSFSKAFTPASIGRFSQSSDDDWHCPCSSNAKSFRSNGARLAACLPGASKPASILAHRVESEQRTTEDEHRVHHSFSNSTRPFLSYFPPSLRCSFLHRFFVIENDRYSFFLGTRMCRGGRFEMRGNENGGEVYFYLQGLGCYD